MRRILTALFKEEGSSTSSTNDLCVFLTKWWWADLKIKVPRGHAVGRLVHRERVAFLQRLDVGGVHLHVS